jgi:hypothetical protein
MADENRFRTTRGANSYRRMTEPSRPEDDASGYAGASDPLAELARLIGKHDPYVQFGLSDEEPEPNQAYPSPGQGPTDRPRASTRERYGQPHSSSYSSPEHPDDFNRQPLASSRPSSPESWTAGYSPGTPHLPFDDTPDAYAEERSHGDKETYAEEPYYDEDQLHPETQGAFDQEYDDPARATRRGGLATALALIGCAVLGTAGAYGYRSYYGPTLASQPPPVITADNSTPTKIVPVPADSQSGKVIQDRVANVGKEQIVSKQEEPVALKDLGTQSAPRVVLPAPVAPASQAPATTGSISSNEGKKVRTVTIRPDGTVAGAQPSAAPGSGVPVAANPRAAPAARGGPLSLDPQATEPSAAAPARTRTATAPTSPRSGSDAPAASSGFLVQLSSQKTEAEASSSFRSLQAKFPNELGGKAPIIRRADLGTKGVYYRTMVGPFGSSQEASQFCANFKAAGGQCVVPTN